MLRLLVSSLMPPSYASKRPCFHAFRGNSKPRAMDDSRWRLALGAALGVGVAYVAWRARRRTEEVKLAALYVYPVKGCKGHSVARAKVTKWGLENDRCESDRLLSASRVSNRF